MSLKLAILAMLDVESGSGYALWQRFQNSVGFFWQTSHQQLYKELHGLYDSGLIDCVEVAQEGKPDKKVYSLNTSGLAELDKLLAEVASPAKIRDPFLVKIFSGRHLSATALANELKHHQQHHHETLAVYLALEQQILALPTELRQRYHYPYQTLKLGIMYEKTWLQWCEDVLNEQTLT